VYSTTADLTVFTQRCRNASLVSTVFSGAHFPQISGKSLLLRRVSYVKQNELIWVSLKSWVVEAMNEELQNVVLLIDPVQQFTNMYTLKSITHTLTVHQNITLCITCIIHKTDCL